MRFEIIDLLFEIGRSWSSLSDSAHRLPETQDACPKSTTTPPCFSSPRPAERAAWLIEKHRATRRRSRRKLHVGDDVHSRVIGSFRIHRSQLYSLQVSFDKSSCRGLSHDSDGNQERDHGHQNSRQDSYTVSEHHAERHNHHGEGWDAVPNGIGRKIRSPFTATMIPTMRSCLRFNIHANRGVSSLSSHAMTGAVNLTR